MKEKSKYYTIKVTRYNPDTQKIGTDTFKVPADPKLTVLNALHYINTDKRAGISHRYSCGMGICGSCGSMVNGKPTLTCSTFCKDLKQPITISPLKNFPILKDLVVDIDSAMAKFNKVMPYTNLKDTPPPQKILPKNLNKIKQTNNCIKCLLCCSACPVYGHNENFIGPAASVTAFRYNNDIRDSLKNERYNSLAGTNGIFNCTAMGECSAVCPQHVDPSKAIQKMKVKAVKHAVKSIFKK